MVVMHLCLRELYDLRELQQSGGPSLSEEPRVRDDRQGDREDRHHKDRDRNWGIGKETGVLTLARILVGIYERDRDREHDRDCDHPRDRDRDREKDYEVMDLEPDRGRSSDREYDYDRRDHVPRHSELEHDHGHYEAYERHQDRGQYGKLDVQSDHDHYDHPDRDQDLYDEMDEDNYHNE
ncbi:hypothetical protein Acr_03g0018900 [Actinidia rufa]|uniref:Uncharacterized protein n=1 Tax=Actinidia rufa TaxID=165716 RepID=A0A7J0EFZ2_9ERIC|nr:hypothetical protein Acr_03g0018900 [Actinidia rufa]